MLQKYIVMIRDDIKNAMSKRCGGDELNNLLMLLGFLFVVIALFSKRWQFAAIEALIGAVFVGICYMRVFSKDLEKRQRENAIYMKHMGEIVHFTDYLLLCLKMKIKSITDKEYVYFVCSQCKRIIRVPKGKNKVSIRCPKCNHVFVKRT
mgnify:CR=1 FL=1